MTARLPTVAQFTRHTLQDSVYDHLREALMSGGFPPGARLTVRGVAEQMGTSPMPVREAFRRLTSEGALEPLSTGATRVPILDSGKIAEIAEIRLEVEGLATRRAAHRITDAELEELKRAHTEVIAAIRNKDATAEARANERFHFCIYRAAGSAELLRIIEHLWLKIGPCIITLLSDHQASGDLRARRTTKDHANIIDALRQHDPDKAESALRADLTAGASFLADRSQLAARRPRD